MYVKLSSNVINKKVKFKWKNYILISHMFHETYFQIVNT
jgi:hypothetical protein